VYSFGEDNSDGQLGLGHTYPTEYPELIQCLKDIGERIDSIECGYRHAIAKSSLGKIYTWGSSNKGQLGHDHLHSELSPRYLQIDKKNNKKVVQIAAGYSHCIVMMEHNKEIYWFGTCGALDSQKFPIQVDFAKYLPDLFGQNI
jgi:alpha-tubulin suppressor-like RCC1 family protein